MRGIKNLLHSLCRAQSLTARHTPQRLWVSRHPFIELAHSAHLSVPTFWAAPAAVFSRRTGAAPRAAMCRVAPSTPERIVARNCLDCGDWVVVTFLFSFAAVGATYCFEHPGATEFGLWTGTLGILCGTFHWLRVKDSKQPDAENVNAR